MGLRVEAREELLCPLHMDRRQANPAFGVANQLLKLVVVVVGFSGIPLERT